MIHVVDGRIATLIVPSLDLGDFGVSASHDAADDAFVRQNGRQAPLSKLFVTVVTFHGEQRTRGNGKVAVEEATEPTDCGISRVRQCETAGLRTGDGGSVHQQGPRTVYVPRSRRSIHLVARQSNRARPSQNGAAAKGHGHCIGKLNRSLWDHAFDNAARLVVEEPEAVEQGGPRAGCFYDAPLVNEIHPGVLIMRQRRSIPIDLHHAGRLVVDGRIPTLVIPPLDPRNGGVPCCGEKPDDTLIVDNGRLAGHSQNLGGITALNLKGGSLTYIQRADDGASCPVRQGACRQIESSIESASRHLEHIEHVHGVRRESATGEMQIVAIERLTG